VIPHRRRLDPPAQRGQPRREGPDAWATPACLIAALCTHVLPALPEGAIWEPAAGDGQLAAAIRAAGRRVVTSDLHPQGDSAPLDFLNDTLPVESAGSVIATNPPFHALDAFINRSLTLLDSGHTQGAALLLRHDHLTAASRAPALNRATWQLHMNWRPRWITGSTGQPRWSFCWVVWGEGPRCAPTYVTAPRRSSKGHRHQEAHEAALSDDQTQGQG